MKGTIELIKVLSGNIRVKDALTGSMRVKDALTGELIDSCAPVHPHARVTEAGVVRITENVDTRIPN